MIIIGFSGIGKSTVTESYDNFIDLESNHFWVNDKLVENWQEVYCNIANDLSRQGYNVFVSSHPEVRSQLIYSNQKIISVFPSLELHKEWIDKAMGKYTKTKSEKDLKTLVYVTKHYKNDITELLADDNFSKVIIHDINYSLVDLIMRRERNEQQ